MAVEAPPGLCYGRLDLAARPATAEEIGAFRQTLEELRAPRWHSSPAQRCRSLAGAIGVGIACLDPDVLEFDFGCWEGLRWSEVPRDALDRWAADPYGFTAPGGEATQHFIGRVASFADRLRREARDAVVVTHGGPLRLLPALLRGEPPDLLRAAPPCGSLSVLHVKG